MNFEDKINALEQRVTLLERAETLRQPIAGETFKIADRCTNMFALNDDLTKGPLVARTFILPVKGSPARESALIEIGEVLALEGLRLVEIEPSTPA